LIGRGKEERKEDDEVVNNRGLLKVILEFLLLSLPFLSLLLIRGMLMR
jgi:hypothetical protein